MNEINNIELFERTPVPKAVMKLAIPPFLCMDYLAVGVFESCGMGKKAFTFAVLRKIVLEIPALYVLNRVWPMYGLVYAQLIAEIILSVAAVFAVFKIIKRNNAVYR